MLEKAPIANISIRIAIVKPPTTDQNIDVMPIVIISNVTFTPTGTESPSPNSDPLIDVRLKYQRLLSDTFPQRKSNVKASFKIK